MGINSVGEHQHQHTVSARVYLMDNLTSWINENLYIKIIYFLPTSTTAISANNTINSGLTKGFSQFFSSLLHFYTFPQRQYHTQT